MRAIWTQAVLATLLGVSVAHAEGIDECAACHKDASTLGPHVAAWAQHAKVSCVACHGGDASQKAEEKAHAKEAPSELLKGALIQSTCIECHLPGSVAGTEMVALGAKTFLDLGCQVCHVAMGFGSLEAWAPPLDVVGFKGSAYLKQMLNRPSEVFPKTRMPTFSNKWEKNPERETALLAFLLSLKGKPRPTPSVSVEARCQSCHSGAEALAASTMKKHRCQMLTEMASDMNCARCHPKGTPKSERECLYIEQRRFDCGACHMGKNDGS